MQTTFKVNKEQLDAFDYVFPVYALKGRTYGQAFCDYFGLDENTTVYSFIDYKITREWIEDVHLDTEYK